MKQAQIDLNKVGIIGYRSKIIKHHIKKFCLLK